MPQLNARTFQMLGRYLPGSGTAVDPLFAPKRLAKYGGDFDKMVPPRLRDSWEAFRDEIGREVDTYAKFLAKYPGGKRPK